MQIDLAQHLGSPLHGHVGLVRRADVLRPVRLPAGARRLHDPFTRWMAAMTAGIRLRLVTESPWLRRHFRSARAAWARSSANTLRMLQIVHDFFHLCRPRRSQGGGWHARPLWAWTGALRSGGPGRGPG